LLDTVSLQSTIPLSNPVQYEYNLETGELTQTDADEAADYEVTPHKLESYDGYEVGVRILYPIFTCTVLTLYKTKGSLPKPKHKVHSRGLWLLR
jgi:hypothetical protein